MPTLHRIAALVAVLTLVGVAAVAVAQDADVAARARVERYLAGLASLRADFSQDVVGADGTAREQAEGVLYLQKPGRFRWDYREPYRQELVSDGERVWLYDVDLEQVTVRAVSESLSTTPAMLLSGRGDVADTFDVKAGGAAEGLEWAVLTPKREESDFRLVRLGFRGKELERMELADRLGQTARVRFSGIERNPSLEPGLFEFAPPPGVDVVGDATPR